MIRMANQIEEFARDYGLSGLSAFIAIVIMIPIGVACYLIGFLQGCLDRFFDV